jgi:hypothetical protein
MIRGPRPRAALDIWVFFGAFDAPAYHRTDDHPCCGVSRNQQSVCKSLVWRDRKLHYETDNT